MNKNLSIALTPALIAFIMLFVPKNTKAQQYIDYTDSVNTVKQKYDMIDRTLDEYKDSSFTIAEFYRTAVKCFAQETQTLKGNDTPESSDVMKKLEKDIKYLQDFCQDIYDIEGNALVTTDACKWFSNMCRNTEISRFNRLAKKQDRRFEKLTNARIQQINQLMKKQQRYKQKTR